MLAYDDQFLYVAIAARLAEQLDYNVEERTRQRDADLASHDTELSCCSTSIASWTTYFRLVVDHRGWAREDCWGDASWNPRWFVAAAHDAESWICEAAIPLSELSTEPVGPNTTWALGLKRIVPGAGLQSWTRPATVQIAPEGAGYLIFD